MLRIAAFLPFFVFNFSFALLSLVKGTKVRGGFKSSDLLVPSTKMCVGELQSLETVDLKVSFQVRLLVFWFNSAKRSCK